jgi:hypothetical protein
MLGTQELAFFRLYDDASPASGVSKLSLPATLAEPEAPAMPELLTAADAQTTTRAAALELVGSLSRRFAQEGKAEEASSLLIPHLKRILRGANSGLEASEALCEQASDYAMDVAVWTADAAWLDYVVELHLASERVMSHSAIMALQRAERWLGPIDRLLLHYYLRSFAARSRTVSEGEQLRLRLLERLLAAGL